MERISEEAVRGTANICGSHSGAAKALLEAEAKRAEGKEVQFFTTRGGIIVASRDPQ
jgi:hypothetical protein